MLFCSLREISESASTREKVDVGSVGRKGRRGGDFDGRLIFLLRFSQEPILERDIQNFPKLLPVICCCSLGQKRISDIFFFLCFLFKFSKLKFHKKLLDFQCVDKIRAAEAFFAQTSNGHHVHSTVPNDSG